MGERSELIREIDFGDADLLDHEDASRDLTNEVMARHEWQIKEAFVREALRRLGNNS